MNNKQFILILVLGISSVFVPSFTLGLSLMCLAVGAYLAVVLSD